MFRNPDHVTVAVTEPDAAIEFFGLLGFSRGHVATIDGGAPAVYMGMPDMKAQHITLVLDGSEPRFEVQLLVFDPTPDADPGALPTNHRRDDLQLIKQLGIKYYLMKPIKIRDLERGVVELGASYADQEQGVVIDVQVTLIAPHERAERGGLVQCDLVGGDEPEVLLVPGFAPAELGHVDDAMAEPLHVGGSGVETKR